MWREFVQLAEKREDSFVTLCARFGISRKTGYKWLNRYRAHGEAGLRHQSRRPKSSPRRTPDHVVDAVLDLRRAQPDWSTARLRDELVARALQPLPATSTIDLILRRHREWLAAQVPAADAHRNEPNFRWSFRQGADVILADGTPAAAVFVSDESTGFILGAMLLTTRREETLLSLADELLRHHGLPRRVQLPRAVDLRDQAASRAHSPLSVWLMRLGITVEFSFGGPGEETDADAEARRQLALRLSHLPAYQRRALGEPVRPVHPLAQFAAAAPRLTAATAVVFLEQLREQNNFGGKLEAMQRQGPLSRFRPSPRALPEELPAPAYPPDSDLRLVSEKGIFTFQRRLVHVGRAFAGLNVQLAATPYPSRFTVFFARHPLGTINLSAAPIDGTTSLQLSPL